MMLNDIEIINSCHKEAKRSGFSVRDKIYRYRLDRYRHRYRYRYRQIDIF